jgi:hypothetical protein
MKDGLKVVGILFLVTVVFLVWYAFTASGTLFIQSYIYPQWLGVQRSAVESSKSFVDSNNIALANLQTEFYRLDTKIAEAGQDSELANTYKAQQEAVVNQMCMKVVRMKSNTVAPEITVFLAKEGGCK